MTRAGFLVICGMVLAWVSLLQLPLGDPLERATLDWRYAIRGSLPNGPLTPVYVEIDSRTVSALGDRPWDRALFAEAGRLLLERGRARAVGYDLLFSPLSHSGLVDPEEALRGDRALGRLLQDHPEQIVLGVSYTGAQLPYEEGRSLLTRDWLAGEQAPYPEMPTWPVIDFDYGFGSDRPDWTRGRLGLVATMPTGDARGPLLVGWTRYEGDAHVKNMLYGLMRGYPDGEMVRAENGSYRFLRGEAERRFPATTDHRFLSFGLSLYLAGQRLEEGAVAVARDALSVPGTHAEAMQVPLGEGYLIEPNWPRPWSEADRVSLVEILLQGEREVGSAEAFWTQFADRVIILCPTDPVLGDRSINPLETYPVPSATIHGAFLETLATDRFLHRMTPGWAWVVSLLPGLLLAAGVLQSGRAAWGLRGATLLVWLGYGLMALVAFSQWDWVLPLAAPMSGGFVAITGGLAFTVLRKERQRQRVERQFGAYVSPKVVARIVAAEVDPSVGGETREVTAYFSDIQGFSPLVEELEADELVGLLQEYFTEATGCILAEGGTLDKFVGDALVAMFGAPVPLAEAPAAALRSALAMQERQQALIQRWQAERPTRRELTVGMRTRVGISHGQAMIGNFGSHRRFNYTMMGECAILAARCERWAKEWGAFVVTTEETLAAAGGKERWVYRHLETRQASEGSRPIGIAEVLGERQRTEPDRIELAETFSAALDALENKDFGLAQKLLQTCDRLEPHQPGQAAGVRTNPTKRLRAKLAAV